MYVFISIIGSAKSATNWRCNCIGNRRNKQATKDYLSSSLANMCAVRARVCFGHIATPLTHPLQGVQCTASSCALNSLKFDSRTGNPAWTFEASPISSPVDRAWQATKNSCVNPIAMNL